jgi:hypothetical protein
MLFRRRRIVTALIAIVPSHRPRPTAPRYAGRTHLAIPFHGIRLVPPHLIEPTPDHHIATGCTRAADIVARLQLPLALRKIRLGITRPFLFALSMLVITALVGDARTWGRRSIIALTKVDTGRGIIGKGCASPSMGIRLPTACCALPGCDRFRPTPRHFRPGSGHQLGARPMASEEGAPARRDANFVIYSARAK